jgi:hypothetical protein
MASAWTGSIFVGVTEANISYIAMGTADVHGHAVISGNASFGRGSEPSRQEFGISLMIDGRSASQAKREATVWPDAFDEVTANDDVIGIILEANVFEHRHGNLFLHSSQFDKIMHLMGLATRAGVTLFLRESTQPECYLIVRADFGTTLIAPEQ